MTFLNRIAPCYWWRLRVRTSPLSVHNHHQAETTTTIFKLPYNYACDCIIIKKEHYKWRWSGLSSLVTERTSWRRAQLLKEMREAPVNVSDYNQLWTNPLIMYDNGFFLSPPRFHVAHGCTMQPQPHSYQKWAVRCTLTASLWSMHWLTKINFYWWTLPGLVLMCVLCVIPQSVYWLYYVSPKEFQLLHFLVSLSFESDINLFPNSLWI